MKHTEVELKFSLPDPAALTQRLTGLGAQPLGENRQTDVCFNAPHRDFLDGEVVSEWLRLRTEIAGDGRQRHSVNFKRWLPPGAAGATHCDEFESAAGDREAPENLLLTLDFTEMVTVDKTRRQWRQFEQYYLDGHQSLAEIAKQAGLSRGYAAQLARDYKIPVRGQKGYTVNEHPVVTRDWLHHQYVTRGRSLQEPATDSGVSKSAIRRWAKIYAIPTQPRYPIRMNIAAAAAAAPPLLQPAITGPGAWKRRTASPRPATTLRSATQPPPSASTTPP